MRKDKTINNALYFAGVYSGIAPLVLFVAFKLNFWFYQGALPAYKVIAWPGIVATYAFTEEIDYWPKLWIMLAGQYLFYFALLFVLKQLFNSYAHSR